MNLVEKNELYSDQQNVIIKRIKYFLIIVYVLSIFEGALRKWAFPQLSSVLFFVKDPFVLYIYWVCFYYKLFPKSFYLRITIVLALLFYFLMSLQSLLIPFNIFAGIYGWRTYFFFVPMAFIIGEYFQKEDLIKIAKFTCIIGIPIAVLTYIQYSSPMDSYINRNVGLEESSAFTVVDDIVRPSGTFSFTIGQSNFICSLVLFLFFNFFLKKEEKFLSKPLFIICIFAFFANLAVCGSRGSYISVVIVLLFLFLASIILLNKKQGYNILIYLVFTILVTVFMFYFIFDKEWDIINRRQEIAESSEGSIFKRMFSLFISMDFFKQANPPLLGYGLGLSSGGGSFLVTGKSSFGLAETDWARNILEAGMLLGTAYVLYRIFFTFHIIKVAIKSIIKSKNPMPFVFLGFVVPSLLIGSITGNGTSNIYNWIFVGFALAINKVYLQEGQNVNKQDDN